MDSRLIVSPYPDGHVIVRRGRDGGVRIGSALYAQLRDAPADAVVPTWLVEAASQGLSVDVTGRTVGGAVMVRPETPYGYARASYELNLGCNFDCEHCYLGEKRFEGLKWPDRERLLNTIAESGVLWLQLTGGEPLIDSLFAETHAYAWDLGMMIQLSSNGSTLYQTKVLDLLTERPPYRLTLSIYGGTEESYDAMTRRRGSFKKFMRGLAAAHEAGLNLRLNIVVSNRNDHEIPLMREIAQQHGAEAFEYTQISPTFQGSGDVLPSQSRQVMRSRTPYTGCNAGITHYHADPNGLASICKIGRQNQVDLIVEGTGGLSRLVGFADAQLTRHGGCSGCGLQKTCGTCMPLVTLYRQAQAPLDRYCQH
jgi:MoaA/NifB/PqqE/SkfB family radical SAM enzyme